VELDRCAFCGADPARLIKARFDVRAAVQFLKGNVATSGRTIMPSLTYESGVLDALDWVLGLDSDGLFQKHLDGLALVRPAILSGRRQK
jgi:hypothetical protein